MQMKYSCRRYVVADTRNEPSSSNRKIMRRNISIHRHSSFKDDRWSVGRCQTSKPRAWRFASFAIRYMRIDNCPVTRSRINCLYIVNDMLATGMLLFILFHTNMGIQKWVSYHSYVRIVLADVLHRTDRLVIQVMAFALDASFSTTCDLHHNKRSMGTIATPLLVRFTAQFNHNDWCICFPPGYVQCLETLLHCVVSTLVYPWSCLVHSSSSVDTNLFLRQCMTLIWLYRLNWRKTRPDNIRVRQSN